MPGLACPVRRAGHHRSVRRGTDRELAVIADATRSRFCARVAEAPGLIRPREPHLPITREGFPMSLRLHSH